MNNVTKALDSAEKCRTILDHAVRDVHIETILSISCEFKLGQTAESQPVNWAQCSPFIQ